MRKLLFVVVRRSVRRDIAGGCRWEEVAGAWCADDVCEGGVLDVLILGGQPAVVLELVLPPGRDVELLQEEVGVFADPVQVPAGGAAAQS